MPFVEIIYSAQSVLAFTFIISVIVALICFVIRRIARRSNELFFMGFFLATAAVSIASAFMWIIAMVMEYLPYSYSFGIAGFISLAVVPIAVGCCFCHYYEARLRKKDYSGEEMSRFKRGGITASVSIPILETLILLLFCAKAC